MEGKRLGRIHISEEELSQWLGFKGGRIIEIGHMPDYNALGIIIEHPAMPFVVSPNGYIPQVERSKR